MASSITSAARKGKTLPALIASFPGNPDGLLVRRTLWPSEAFVRVTRANLKFRDRSAMLAKSQKPGPSSRAIRTGVGLKVGAPQATEQDEAHDSDDLRVGELWPSGKVYGMEFWQCKRGLLLSNIVRSAESSSKMEAAGIRPGVARPGDPRRDQERVGSSVAIGAVPHSQGERRRRLCGEEQDVAGES